MFWLIVVAALAEPIALSVTPRAALAPADLRLVLTISTHPDNRYWWVGMASGTSPFERSSSASMEGAKAPRVVEVYWRNIPAGEYTVTAVVGHQRGIRGRDHAAITIR